MALCCFFSAICAAHASDDSHQPRRQDFGDLTLLDVYGSYYEMGRQQMQLLGDDGRKQFEFQYAAYKSRATGFRGRAFDLLLPVGAWVESVYDDSGLIDESRGFASGIGLRGSDGVRFLLGSLPSGSTTFAATRSATGDGHALIGRNVDWADGDGRLRPVVVRFHPNNGDLAHMTAGWALSGGGALGLNEAGFAMSFNWFPGAYQPVRNGLPQWPNRRVLQRARTVDEGIRIFQEANHRGVAAFITMADAVGNIAMVECTSDKCVVFRPDRDWFCVANHAQTDEMIARDTVRTPDSFRRLAAMEDAVRPFLGRINPAIAAQIIRDRSNSPYVNDSVVANPMVFNAAIIQPATKTLWHSTRRQPSAPFGEMVASTFSSPQPEPIAPDPQLSKPEMDHEVRLIAKLRRAERLFEQERIAESERAYDDLAGERSLEPQRLVWARARTRWTLGKLEEADSLLARLDLERSPFEIAIWSLAMRGVIADWRGRRKEALQAYQKAQDLLLANPQYRLPDVHKLITHGLASPASEAEVPATPDLQYALLYPGVLGLVMPRVRDGAAH